MSDAFKMRITPANGLAVRGHAHAVWLDVLALASKHSYEDLFDKATDFLVDEVMRAGLKGTGQILLKWPS